MIDRAELSGRDRRLPERLESLPTLEDLEQRAEQQDGSPGGETREMLSRRARMVLQSDIASYWAFMTGSRTKDGCLDPGWEPWNRMETGLEEAAEAGKQILREQVLPALYDLSIQDSILLRDTVRYTARPGPERWMPAALDDMRAYARRFCLQLNGLLHHAGQELEAAIQVLPRSTGIQVCRFHTGRWDRTRGEPKVREEQPDSLLGQMPENLREQVADRLYAVDRQLITEVET